MTIDGATLALRAASCRAFPSYSQPWSALIQASADACGPAAVPSTEPQWLLPRQVPLLRPVRGSCLQQFGSLAALCHGFSAPNGDGDGEVELNRAAVSRWRASWGVQPKGLVHGLKAGQPCVASMHAVQRPCSYPGHHPTLSRALFSTNGAQDRVDGPSDGVCSVGSSAVASPGRCWVLHMVGGISLLCLPSLCKRSSERGPKVCKQPLQAKKMVMWGGASQLGRCFGCLVLTQHLPDA